jgi:3-dehydroquinate synthase
MRRNHVELGSRSYPVLVGSGLIGGIGELLRGEGLKQPNAFVITNAQVGEIYFAPLTKALTEAGFSRIVRHDIPSTEEGKNWDEFSKTCAAMLKAFPDAGSAPLVLLLGGGVVGDLGGFASAGFRRGVPDVQIPTTLLSAVDSSVGGKVAVNFGGVKNIMGAFSQPRLVACDLEALNTLGNRELRSGLAEVIKYGAVCSRMLFEQLEAGGVERILLRDPATLVDIVSRCIRLKADVVEKDELDKLGIRNVLNFGHTIGHGLELSADYTLTHGEAISVGMVAATRMAVHLKMVDEIFLDRLMRLLTKAGLPNSYPNKPGLFDRIIRAMQMDKKFRDGKNLFVLPTGIGTWEPRENVDWNLVHECTRSVLI